MGQKKRLFFACFPGDQGMDTIAEYHKKLIPWNDVLRLPREENWHITLQFLGEIDEKLSESLMQAQLEPHPFTIQSLRPEIYAGNRPPVLVLAVKADKGLQSNWKMVKELCRAHNICTKKDFRPHITLAYVRKTALPRLIHRICATWMDDAPISYCNDHCTGIDLVQSILSPKGSRYISQKRWFLDTSASMTQH